MAGGGIGEAMLISAAMGGGTAAVTGGDPLKGALLGAATGGIGHGIAGATAAGGAGAASGAGSATTTAATTGADIAAQAPEIAAQSATMGNIGAGQSFYGADLAQSGITPAQVGAGQLTGQAGAQAASNPMFPKIAEMSKSGYFYPGLGAMGATVGGALTPQTDMPGGSKYSGPLSRFRYDPEKYKRQMATGGLANTAPAQRMMQGSQLGSYSDGGQLLSGPGNGMSDDIPASIGGKQPARLADGEFVIPADVVSGIGNGSTGAGADELYKLLDRVRLARTGSDKQGREISPMKYLPT
jgi:hypothetical protein